VLNNLRFSWDIDGQPYEVEVDLQQGFIPQIVEIYAESGTRIPPLDWDAHGFTEFEQDLIVATAYKLDRRTAVCRCGDKCYC